MLIHVLLLFLLVNSFYVGYPLNSSILAAFIAIILGLIFRPHYIATTRHILLSKTTVLLFAMIFFTGAASVLVALMHSTYDFSYTKNLFSQSIQLTLVVLVIAFIFTDRAARQDPLSYISKLIVWIFVVQSILETIAFLSPTTASIIHLTYTPKALEKLYEGYSGIRGLALTGSPGWGLAIGYGLSFIIYTKEYISERRFSIHSALVFLILAIGALFAGRSAFVGIIVSALFFLLANGSTIGKFKKFIALIVTFSGLLLSVYFSLQEVVILFTERVFPFVFEFYYTYVNTGAIETGSTNRLLEMWQVPIPEKTWLIGDGWFTDPDTGNYYKRTDVGYIRNLLFGGLLWAALVFTYNFILASGFRLANRSIIWNDKLLILCFLIYSILLEFKAMALGFNKYLFTIFAIYYLVFTLDSIKTKSNEI